MSTHQKGIALFRDIGAGNVVRPTVSALGDRGVSIPLCAEQKGAAAARLEQLGVSAYILPENFDAESLLRDFNPSFVITGLSSPRVLESALDRVAKDAGIPVIVIEDQFGTIERSVVEPDLVLTINETTARLVRKKYPNAKIVPVGLAGILPVTPRPEVVAQFEELRQATGAKIFVFTDGDVMCEPGLRIFIECLKLTKTPWRLVPNFHPKYVNAVVPGEALTWGQRWNAVIDNEHLREQGFVVDIACTGDEAAMLADAIASSFSTLLFRAAREGKHVITVWTPEMVPHLKRVSGLDETPLMLMGGYPVVYEPQPLDEILASTPLPLDLEPFNAAKAADEVLTLLWGRNPSA